MPAPRQLPTSVGLKCSNFKCFAEAGQGFEAFKPMNVIIGRNNSGKSTLLDLVQHACLPSPLADRSHRGATPSTTMSWQLTEDEIAKLDIPKRGRVSIDRGRVLRDINPEAWAKTKLAGKTICMEMGDNGQVALKSVPDGVTDGEWDVETLRLITPKLTQGLANPFAGVQFRRLLADRDIVPEASSQAISIAPNGAGFTNAVQGYINYEWLSSELVEQQLLRELNKILRPDAEFRRIVVQQRKPEQNGMWEIHLEETDKGRIPMSHTGSGIKTILLVLGNLFLVPAFAAQKDIKKYAFGFEELENNLHPAVQRRLLQYLRQFASVHGCTFFITTHSSVAIDLFSKDEDAQILHVRHDGSAAVCSTVTTTAHGWQILDDLDVRASDVLQSNAVVWVEGPSDRIYFKRWVELWTDNEVIEGIHYQCLPVGGASNAHFSFENPADVNELIAAMKVNRHAVLLVDSDRSTVESSLKGHTQRLIDEINDVGGYPWVTQGKEVENYIPFEALRPELGETNDRGPAVYTSVLKYLAKKKQIDTEPNKVDLARRVTARLTREQLEATLDMAGHLDAVCNLIRKWNKIEPD